MSPADSQNSINAQIELEHIQIELKNGRVCWNRNGVRSTKIPVDHAAVEGITRSAHPISQTPNQPKTFVTFELKT